MHDFVVITDVGSVDPDDIFALVILSTFTNIGIRGVIASHFFSDERAKIVKLILTELGRSEIPVYAGTGVRRLGPTEYPKMRKEFMEENPLFPKQFGFPQGVCVEEKEWFPNFLKAYDEFYTQEKILSMQIEEKSGPDFLTEILQNYSPDKPLNVICLGPMHDLAAVPENLYPRMQIFAMGGGFADERDGLIRKMGYNWGICPQITNQVLTKLKNQSGELILISSDFIRKKQIVIPVETYDAWIERINLDKKSVPVLTRAIMKDWFYCNRSNKLAQHKNLCDPLTLLMAIDMSYHYELFNGKIINYEKMNSYLDKSDEVVMEMIPDENGNGNIGLVMDYWDDIYDPRQKIINLIETHLGISFANSE